MALTLSAIKKYKMNREFKVIATVALSGSYPAGGEPLDLTVQHFLRKEPDLVRFVGSGGFNYTYDAATKKVIVRVNDAGGANAPMGVHTTAAYAGGVSADVIKMEALWAF